MNNFWLNYQYLCAKNGESVYDVARKFGIKSTSSVVYWKQGSKPKAEVLQQICDYFNVTATDLLHNDLEQREKNAHAYAQALDDPLYAAIVKLTPEQRVLVKGFIAGLRANENMQL